MLKILGALLGVLVAVVIVLAALAYFRVIPIPGPILALIVGSNPPEHSARYYPQDTLAYVWMSLTPSGGQLNEMMDIWERFNEFRAFEDLVAELKDDFQSETGIDFDDDVVPWIGPDASVGFMGYDARNDIPLIAATVGVRDHEAAGDFMDQWLEYMERTERADFDSDSHGDFDTWVDEGVQQAYALSDDLLVFATSEDTLEETLDLAGGDSDRSLSSNEEFRAARSALPGERFFSVYVATRDAVELAETLPSLAPLEASMLGLTGLSSQIPDWVAASGGWVERGVALEIVAPTTTESGLEVPELEDPSRLLPHDTLAYLAFGFDPDLDRWRDELEEHDLADILPFPGMVSEINTELDRFARSQGVSTPRLLPSEADMSDVLDAALWYGEELYGIDFEAEFFEYLEGQLILAVSEFDFAEQELDAANNPVNAVAVLSYDESAEEDLRHTMDDIGDLVEEHLPFIQADNADVGADEDAVVFPIDSTEYAPGYVLHEGYLTLGSTEDALEAIVKQQDGDDDPLESVSEHQRAVGHLPGDAHFQGYVNLQDILDQFGADDVGLEPGEYRILEEGLGAVAISSSYDDEQSRGTLVLTLFPE